MYVPMEVQAWLDTEGFGQVAHTHPVSGGCINNGVRLETTSGRTFFLKTNQEAPKNLFAAEAEGLAEFGKAPGCPRFPHPYIYGTDFLLLEDLAPAPRKPDYWEVLGRQLAALHQYTQPVFGFFRDNYIGSTVQPNPQTEDGYIFFAEQRLDFQAGLAARKGLLTPPEVRLVNRLAARLNELVPPQPASLLHGDLWGGNMISDANGDPAIIDPAPYYGWAEADLAMTVLFGAPPDTFFRAYEEVSPLPSGLFGRFPMYNLYHLLNHLNIFGRGYYEQVMAILRQHA